MDILRLRTKLSIFSLKWNNMPNLEHFIKYKNILDTQLDISNMRIIGYILPQNKRYNLNNFDPIHNSIYLISNLEDHIYISLGLSHPSLWSSIKYNSIDNINTDKIYDIIQLYDMSNSDDYDTIDYILLGNINNLNINLAKIQNNLLITRLIEPFMWGSKYGHYPFNRKLVTSATNKEKIIYISQAMEQKTNKSRLSCRTIWSKSLLKITHKNDYINIEVRYNTYPNNEVVKNINQKYDKNFPTDMPTDLVMALLQYPFISYRHIINQHDNIEEIKTLLDIMIPRKNIYEILINLNNICNDKNKNRDLRATYQLTKN
jgi:hypothetical protein